LFQASRAAFVRIWLGGWLVLLANGCSTSTARPDNAEDMCAIFREKSDWYEAALDMNRRWGTPLQVPMAMMYQESSFRYDA
jgi:hypothetical protein